MPTLLTSPFSLYTPPSTNFFFISFEEFHCFMEKKTIRHHNTRKFKQNVLAHSHSLRFLPTVTRNSDWKYTWALMIRCACARAFCDKKKKSTKYIPRRSYRQRKESKKINIMLKICKRMHLRQPPHQPATSHGRKVGKTISSCIVVDYAFDFYSIIQ